MALCKVVILIYQVKQMDDLEGKKLKLMAGKRFHTNAKNAYWYYGIKADK